jgi:alkanesulfonate monooxygenase SsuD/methylene tetrahydromethanopterin reductase-like flavin-dependent oxidoreductase (luciferase family)
MPMFLTRYDFRAPGAESPGRREAFARALEQAGYADRHGWDGLVLSEHHATDDGYLPSPLTVAAAMAARTERIPISVAALLINLYDPIRLAEDITVLDDLSAGRISYTFGLGYRPEEYAALGRPWATRGADADTAITALLAALEDPHPLLFYGGRSRAAAERAARLGLNFQPQVADPALAEHYRQACSRAGRVPGLVFLPSPGPAYVFCADDPEQFWSEYGHHLLADAQAYRAWAADNDSFVLDHSRTVDELREAGRYLVLRPDDLVARCRRREIRVVTTHPLCAGLPAKPSWENLRLIGEQVIPAVRGTGE